MDEYLEHLDKKIQQLTNIAKEKSKSPHLMEMMDEHAFEGTLDRLHLFHSRKQMIEKYIKNAS